MKIHTKRMLLPLLALLLIAVSVSAQDPQPSDEMQIKSLRASIQVMVENAPASDAPDAKDFARRLGSLRSQLLMLLAKKTGALEVRIHNLEAPGVLPEVQAHAQQLRQELKEVETEIVTVEGAMAINGGVVLSLTPPEPARPKAQPPGASLTKTEAQKNFEAQVASISSDQIEKAAIPAAVAKGPIPTCNENGRPAATTFSKLDEAICGLARDITDPDIREIDLENDQANLMTILIAQLLKAKDADGESYSAFVTEAQEMRLDQQMGAGPTSNSATSLVSKGGIPYLLGLAVENGAARESTKDTSITFRINPGGVINTLAGKGFITGYQASEDDPALKFLRKTSVGLTFDTSRGNTPGTFTGSKQQLSQISARIEFINDRDPRQKRYASQWEKLVANEGVKLAAQTWKTTTVLTNWSGTGDITFIDPALQAWLNETNKKVALVKVGLTGVARFDAVAAVISEQANRLPVNLVSQKVVDTLTDFARESKTYSKAKNDLLDTIARGKIFTLDYTNTRNVNAPDTSNFNFIASTGTTARIDLTANGSFTFFHQRPAVTAQTPRPGRIRDFQFAAQLAVPFKVGDTQFDFWFGGRYERLLEDASTFAGATVPGTKGDIAVGQFGFNIPIKGLGVKFPVSFTFANRTELVKEKEVRGNFGFTFNWDTLLSKLKPF
jgi:hypothetical protein